MLLNLSEKKSFTKKSCAEQKAFTKLKEWSDNVIMEKKRLWLIKVSDSFKMVGKMFDNSYIKSFRL